MHRVDSAMDASSLQGDDGDGLAMPMEDEDLVTRGTRDASVTLWWGFSSAVLCAGILLHSRIPWWLALIAAAEAAGPARL